MKSEEIVLRVLILQKNVFANMSVKLQIYNNFIDVQTKFSFRDSQSTSLADGLTPSIVRIGYHFGAVAVNQTNDVILLVVEVSVGSTIVVIEI